MASKPAKRANDTPIAEHDVVRLLATIPTNEGLVAVGTLGTVVYIHRGGEAFEVDFDAPFHVVTIMADLVERVPV